jgi:hypothetical protein
MLAEVLEKMKMLGVGKVEPKYIDDPTLLL